MKKMNKKRNKNKKKYIKILTIMVVLGVVLGLITKGVILFIDNQKTTYQYATNGEIRESNYCYFENGIGYCEKDSMIVKVDNYYEKIK